MTLDEAREFWSAESVATAALEQDDYLHFVRTCTTFAAADLFAAGATHCQVRAHVLDIHAAVNRIFMDRARALWAALGHA